MSLSCLLVYFILTPPPPQLPLEPSKNKHESINKNMFTTRRKISKTKKITSYKKERGEIGLKDSSFFSRAHHVFDVLAEFLEAVRGGFEVFCRFCGE
jgi:hypothetical protein